MKTTDRVGKALGGIAIVTGTATTNTANKLADSGGGLSVAEVGDLVLNTTDDKFGYVKAVDSDTALSIKDVDGADMDLFPDGDETYAIYSLSAIDELERDTTKVNKTDRTFLAEYQTDLSSGTNVHKDRRFQRVLDTFFQKIRY